MAEDWADKTESATPHKRAQARRDGNLPRSDDLTAAAACIALMLLLRQTGAGATAAMKTLMSESFAGGALSIGRIGYLIGISILPLLIGLILAGVAAGLLQTGFFFGWRKESGALDPAKGFSSLFSTRSAAQLGLNALKLGIVSAVVYVTARGYLAHLLALITSPSTDLFTAGGSLAFAIGIRVSIVLLMLGVADYAYQRFRHERELRMSRREVKDELRRQEGDSSARNRRRSLARNHLSSTRSSPSAAAAGIEALEGRRA
jgi:flagellar biosynthetic protein FlhB